jgi:hypothetical protein
MGSGSVPHRAVVGGMVVDGVGSNKVPLNKRSGVMNAQQFIDT